MTFTTAVLVEVASRLARDERRPGAYIPGASFGPDLAVQAGGEFIQSPEISTAITRTSAVHANSHARSAASMPIASVMGFRLRAWRFVPAFMFHAHRSLGQLRRAEGFVAGAVRRERNLAYWTMTVWRDEPSMLAYVTGGAHRQAMPKLADWGEEASTGRWERDGLELPDWPESVTRMRLDGRPLPLRHPGTGHADVSFAVFEVTGAMRISVRDGANPSRGA